MTAARGLENRLISSGALRREAVQMARRRQKVYGGGLDTVLLEMGLVDEGTLWALLVEESGLPPLPPALLDGPMMEPQMLLGSTEARRLGAFLFQLPHASGGQIQAVARPGYDVEAVQSALRETPNAEVFIVPEVRFEALMGGYYRQPIPPRFLSLLGRLMGADQVRRWAATRAPRPPVAKPIVDVGPRFDAPAPRPQPRSEPPAQPQPEPQPHPEPQLERQPPHPEPEPWPQLQAQPEPEPQSQPPIEPQPHIEPEAHQPHLAQDKTGLEADDDSLSRLTPAPQHPMPIARAPTPPAEDDVGAAVEAAIDRIAVPLDVSASPQRPSDDLLGALELLVDLEGGPRAPALAAAIVSRWSCAEIFSRLPQVAKRGEHAARAVLPLLAARPTDAALLVQWLQAESPRERAWAALGLQPFLSASLPASATPGSDLLQIANFVRKELCARIERDSSSEVRLAMATALRPAARQPEVVALVQRLAAKLKDSSALDPSRAEAAALMGQLRVDYGEGIEALLTGLAAKSPQVSHNCHSLLVRITGHDAGKNRAAWKRWWQANQDKPRAAWLIDGLGHRQPDVRLAAASELRDLTGQTLGYHFDLPAGLRKAAIVRWKRWLQEQSPPAPQA